MVGGDKCHWHNCHTSPLRAQSKPAGDARTGRTATNDISIIEALIEGWHLQMQINPLSPTVGCNTMSTWAHLRVHWVNDIHQQCARCLRGIKFNDVIYIWHVYYTCRQRIKDNVFNIQVSSVSKVPELHVVVNSWYLGLSSSLCLQKHGQSKP